MAQHDMNIANAGFPAVRSDLNNALSAIQTTHSGTSRPTGAVAGQIWLDTTSATSPTLKYYDGADDISLATIDHSANTVNWLDSTVSVTGLTTTATGTVLTLSDTNLNSTVSIRIPTTKGIDDDSGNEFLKFTKTASAVNEFTIINSATGSAPEIQSTGDDTDIDLKITPKGAGKIILDGLAFPNADGTANQVLQTNGSGVLSFATPSSGANTPAFYGELASNQTLTRATTTKITGMTTNEIDTNSAFDGTTFTVPSGHSGKYYISVTAFGNYDAIGTDGELTRVFIYKNGSSVKMNGYYNQAGDAREFGATANIILSLVATDTIEMYAFLRDVNGGNAIVNANQTSILGYKIIE